MFKKISKIVKSSISIALTGVLLSGTAFADSWQLKYSEVTLGVITSENEADRVTRYKPVRQYLKNKLGVKIKWRTATDYAGIIEGVKARKVHLAYFGPASYSKCWIVTGGKVEPLVGELDKAGDFGYHSVVVVKKNSGYHNIQDLKGVKLAFADPNSTSGHQAPRYFLTEAGYNPDKYFGSNSFSGSHENSVMALISGTFDAAATWWRSDTRSNFTRMANKGMIQPNQLRVVWKSPKLPSSPWAMPTYLPQQMRTDFRNALMDLPKDDPAAWNALTDGKASGYRIVTHKDYDAIVRMIKANLKNRRSN